MMAKERSSIFEDSEELDVSGFAPKAAPEPNVLPAERVRAVAEASRFPSREARVAPPAEPIPPAEPAPLRRAPRRHRTGRTQQFNARTTPETVEAFYAIADRQGWLVGETLEHALAALKRELEGQGRGAAKSKGPVL
jgi:hypothetical protein